MKATEVRIGNCIQFDEHLFIVNDVVIKQLIEDFMQYQPILLTEEWLFKFGFEKVNHIQLGELFILQWLRIKPKYMFAQWRGASVGKIEYVHQLQNLYFALTGEELIFKT